MQKAMQCDHKVNRIGMVMLRNIGLIGGPFGTIDFYVYKYNNFF